MIHYHGLPMTPITDMVNAFPGRHAMVSFEHPEQIEVAAEICPSIVLDNGAFSAWKAGRKHNFDGYTAWCERWLKHPAVEWCVIPDVIDGDEEANDSLLAAWPLPMVYSVPVYHMHERLSRLAELSDKYGRVALGSSGEYAELKTPRWWARMAEMMEVVCDEDGRPRTKLHGLRMLDTIIFSSVPLASADSCNVSRNVGFDDRWNGPYAPRSRAMRALIMMNRIEAHACAARWTASLDGFNNLELLG